MSHAVARIAGVAGMANAALKKEKIIAPHRTIALKIVEPVGTPFARLNEAKMRLLVVPIAALAGTGSVARIWARMSPAEPLSEVIRAARAIARRQYCVLTGRVTLVKIPQTAVQIATGRLPVPTDSVVLKREKASTIVLTAGYALVNVYSQTNAIYARIAVMGLRVLLIHAAI